MLLHYLSLVRTVWAAHETPHAPFAEVACTALKEVTKPKAQVSLGAWYSVVAGAEEGKACWWGVDEEKRMMTRVMCLEGILKAPGSIYSRRVAATEQQRVVANADVGYY